MPQDFHLGQRISFEAALCTVRYIGTVEGASKEWLGVEWDDRTRGKHDGEHNGKRYFSCEDIALLFGGISNLLQVLASHLQPHPSFAQTEQQIPNRAS